MILLEGLYKEDLENIEENLSNYSYISCGSIERIKNTENIEVALKDLEERVTMVEHTVFFLEADILNELTTKLKDYLLNSKMNVKTIKVKDYTLNRLVEEIKKECQFMK